MSTSEDTKSKPFTNKAVSEVSKIANVVRKDYKAPDGLSLSDVGHLLVRIMEIIEKSSKNMKSNDKKEMALAVLEQIIQEFVPNEDVKSLIYFTLPPFIDLIISATKGGLKLNERVRTICCNPKKGGKSVFCCLPL